MYKKSRETIDHLLLYCSVDDAKWVVKLLACWRSQDVGQCSVEVWQMVPLCDVGGVEGMQCSELEDCEKTMGVFNILI